MDFTVSHHAVERALDMGVAGDEIRECVTAPDRVHWSVRYENEVRTRGRIAVSVSADECVLTIHWATPELWEADLALGEYAGRQLQDMTAWKNARRRRGESDASPH